VELSHDLSAALRGRDGYDITNVHRPKADTVATVQVLVELRDGTNASSVTELLNHVVGTRPRVVSQPNGEVLDDVRLLLEDLQAAKI
tara:strand:- start:357 stop:617 length:261 start_codon:yes stop_codon:yes gene_type:complete